MEMHLSMKEKNRKLINSTFTMLTCFLLCAGILCYIIDKSATPKARAIWEKKQKLIESFTNHLKYDLALDDSDLTEYAKADMNELE